MASAIAVVNNFHYLTHRKQNVLMSYYDIASVAQVVHHGVKDF